MRVLVTGAAGFIGRTLVPQLLTHKAHDVSLLLRDDYATAGRLPSELAAVRDSLANIVYADLRNFRQTKRAVEKCQPEGVIHLAAAGVTQPFLGFDQAIRHNLYGVLNLARALFQESGSARKLIVARTPGESTAMNVYAASKAAGWTFCRMLTRTRGWPILGATVFQAYGPGQHNTIVPTAIAAARAGADFPMTSGRQTRDWIYVSDVAAGLEALLASDLEPGVSADLGTGISTSVVAVVEEIYRQVNKGGKARPGLLPSRPGEESTQIADVTLTARLLSGWRSTIELREGLARLLAATAPA